MLRPQEPSASRREKHKHIKCSASIDDGDFFELSSQDISLSRKVQLEKYLFCILLQKLGREKKKSRSIPAHHHDAADADVKTLLFMCYAHHICS